MAVKATIFWGKLAVSPREPRKWDGAAEAAGRQAHPTGAGPLLVGSGARTAAAGLRRLLRLCGRSCCCCCFASRPGHGTAGPGRTLPYRCRSFTPRGLCRFGVGLGVEAEIAGAMIESCGSAGQDVPS